mmetsp:Transcript_9354/g.28024  ORF Transcript_9354/g.28024 Transcript_9354/m.28024 type:complete len:279 (-) Transcript_9354:175-1011(-)|eukprot:CAMPEP_0119266508 /NCGR_PEP_ID=MMETSP1329-20130426/4965_1 /TAXON_ID=114041 /ORGANISM="Genus nov. species nov., Strain RCC1024" /LENGTH=278 /DNA_ID=CAMNT_0007266391 /DNA_START=387 /DNA_END=1223 /DNA_ORIENTATION=+
MMLLTFLLSSLFACSSAQLRANRRRITGFVGIEGPSHEPEPLECHPAATQILAADGTATPISQLTLGARVASPSGPKRVIAITHSDATMDGSYVRLTTASGAAVEISARHLLPVNGVLKDPIKVAVGDLLQTPAGPEAVARVEVVTSKGAFHIIVEGGLYYADGVLSSDHHDVIPVFLWNMAHRYILTRYQLGWPLVPFERAGLLPMDWPLKLLTRVGVPVAVQRSLLFPFTCAALALTELANALVDASPGLAGVPAAATTFLVSFVGTAESSRGAGL